MELSGNNLLTYLSGHPPQCSMSEETRNWIQGCICNPLLLFAEHHLPLFICALLIPGHILTWAIRQYLKVQEIDRVHKGELDTLNKTLDIIIHSYIKDALRCLHSLLSWEAFISFSVL